MPDDSVVVYAREHYRVVRTEGEDPLHRYVIFDASGLELRREAGFELARAWVDDRTMRRDPQRPARRRRP